MANSNDKIKHLENKFSIARYELIRECDGDELRFYLYLKLYAINKSEAFPSYNAIRTDLSVPDAQWDNRKISRLIQKMVNQGRLKIGKRIVNTRGGKQTANIYDITWYDKINNTGKISKKKVVAESITLFSKGNGKMELKGNGKMKSELSEKILTIKDSPSGKPTTDSSIPLRGEKWDSTFEVERLLEDVHRHIQIIGVWLINNEIYPENTDQIKSFIKRNVRPAMLLKGYSNEDIVETIKILKKTDYIKKITLETVAKYIDETVANRTKTKKKVVKINGKVVIGRKNVRKFNDKGEPYLISVPVFKGEKLESKV